jgi:hypothetical protein
MAPPDAQSTADPELQMAKPKPPPIPPREMPWKKKPPAATPPPQSGNESDPKSSDAS